MSEEVTNKMNLNSLSNVGTSQNRKRVGRGIGSGTGKTAGRGHKGQKSRSGGNVRLGFEGGQMPLYRKLPRRGFNNKNFKVSYQLVNVGQLEKLEGDTVDRESLIAAGLVRENNQGIKLLGNGELSKASTVNVCKVSVSAKSKIEAAGGKIEEAVTEEKEEA